MDKDRIKGSAEEAKGKIKEGHLIGANNIIPLSVRFSYYPQILPAS
jgi:hypothetical protein